MFPEYTDLITRLRQDNPHFSALYDKHKQLDEQITHLLKNVASSVTNADEIERLKKEKLALKDHVYSLLQQTGT